MKYGEALENAISAIEKSILPRCEHFKIGKTGQLLHTRFVQSAYKNEYKHIRLLGRCCSVSAASKLEADLIEKYILCSKCDNIKSGRVSFKDSMASEDGKYRVYIVWE